MGSVREIDGALRPEIAQSWQRCRLAGLRRESPGRPSFSDPDGGSRLMVAAAPVLHELADCLDDNPFSLVLADRDCRIAYRRGHRGLLTFLDGSGISVGVGMDEPSYGTNAIGTSMEAGRPVVVHGPDHYLAPYDMFSCYGHPVQHPLTRRLEGVLTIISDGPVSNPLIRPLLRRAVGDIEARIVESCRATERRLFLAFQDATRRRSAPVAVLGRDILLTNRACLDMLGNADPGLLRALLPEATTREVTRTVDLGAAGRIQVSAEPIEGTPDGVLVRLAEQPAPVLAASTAAVRPEGRSVLVAGEPGTGRTRAASEAAAGARLVTMDAAAALVEPEREWADRLVTLASRDHVVVVEDVHVLPERLCTVLRWVMGSARARVVLTCCPVDELPSHVGQLVARCERRIELAPLRERLHELPALFATLGAARQPDREWVLTPRAIRALCAQSWAGNLAELARLADELADRPLPGRIDLGDLPERYRASTRAARLGERERAERAAIILALRAAGGNKLRAAHRLGISRTTLYRRMRELDIQDAPASK